MLKFLAIAFIIPYGRSTVQGTIRFSEAHCRCCLATFSVLTITLSRSVADVPSSAHHWKINKKLTIFSSDKDLEHLIGVVFEGSYRSRPCAVKALHQLAI